LPQSPQNGSFDKNRPSGHPNGCSAAVFSNDCLPPPASAYRANAELRFETTSGHRRALECPPDGVHGDLRPPAEVRFLDGDFDALMTGSFALNGGALEDLTTTAKLTQNHDVFTELSVDNGLTWVPAVASTRFDLVPRP
jgi:hypothetical protein